MAGREGEERLGEEGGGEAKGGGGGKKENKGVNLVNVQPPHLAGFHEAVRGAMQRAGSLLERFAERFLGAEGPESNVYGVTRIAYGEKGGMSISCQSWTTEVVGRSVVHG
jgi:hypothetical protein